MKLIQRLCIDERGGVAVGYMFVIAFGILMAIAVLGLQLPVRHAETWGVGKLADNTP